jgi:molybdopterin/thiamine biosynthesis adenylyltransferase
MAMSWQYFLWSVEVKMATLQTFLKESAVDDLISWQQQQVAAEQFQLTVAEVETVILQAELLPARYQRNQQMISTAQQLQLFQSQVAVVGCGGLGGYILEELARLGVGQIVAIDPDVFEEHNLNRQLLSTIKLLGTAKTDAAVQRIAEINPAVKVRPINDYFGKENGRGMLSEVDLVIDAVDNIPTRLELAEICGQMNIPMVHGAIAGWYGQVVTIFPGEDTLQKLYAKWNGGKGIEAQLGNPSFTPAVAASLQVAEACKVLLGQGRPLRKRMLSVNLLEMQFDKISL